MCLIHLQLQEHPKYKLIVAANRDELYSRPTEQAHFWKDAPNILAGRDLMQMGTWLGVTKQGRFAALTNYREPAKQTEGLTSRGEIVRNYLAGESTPKDFLASFKQNRDRYNGFNVIAGNPNHLYYYSNRQQEVRQISEGTHGLSNHLLDTCWPKVVKGKEKLKVYTQSRYAIYVKDLFEILGDTEEAAEDALPSTGISRELERKLSAPFIKTRDYGTRCSTVVLVDRENYVTFAERTFNSTGLLEERQFSFQIEAGNG